MAEPTHVSCPLPAVPVGAGLPVVAAVESPRPDAGLLDRVHLPSLALEPVQAHGGVGEIRFRRVADGSRLAGACRFIDYAEVPPGCSIGRHRHAPDEEEFYLVLAGRGRMWLAGREITVQAGDLIRNPPGGEHGFVNDGDEPVRLFVFELAVPEAR